MKNLFTNLFLCLAIAINAQVSYELKWEQGTYTPLTDFTSMLWENQSFCFWTLDGPEISFGFDFPYYDDLFSSVTLESDGVGYFSDDDEEFSLFMFAGEYENFGCDMDSFLSDRRYIHTEIDSQKVLIMEWFNAGISSDVESDSVSDHTINYQVWFYENGNIELHFGEIDLENSPYYQEGVGLFWDDGDVYGPWIGINTTTESEGVYYSGTYQSPTIITDPDSFDILYNIPPDGWILRWERKVSASVSPEHENLTDFNLFPTATNTVLNWELKGINMHQDQEIAIYNNLGQKIYYEKIIDSSGQIDVSNLYQGLYYLTLVSKNSRFSKSFLIGQ